MPNYFMRFSSGILFVCLLSILGCSENNPNEIRHVFCDAETIESKSDKVQFRCQDESFGQGQHQTDEKAYSGKHSILLQKGRQYGMTYSIDEVNEGERFIIRVRRFSESGQGVLALTGKTTYRFNAATNTALRENTERGWELLELDVKVPYGIDSVVIFLRNNSDSPVYFDDLEVIHQKTENPTYEGHATLKLHLDSLDLSEMIELREKALKQGVIDSKTKKEFKCSIVYDGEHYSASIRFKGDWPDHLKTNKWSFRIKLDGGKTIMGKRTFSIQHPETRGYAKEWLIHKLLKKEGVLTTMYEFIPVELNGKNLGLYAIEEHFEKQLLESQNRREGVILKFEEELFWEAALLKKKEKKELYFPTFSTTAIKPFGKKKVMKSDALKNQLVLGNDLLGMYANGLPEIEGYLDIETYTRYLAILTLTNCATHSMEWHNQRWYVNPVTARLEPIGFDFSSHFYSHAGATIIMSFFESFRLEKPVTLGYYLTGFILKNTYAQERYLANIERMITEEYLDSFFEEMKPEINTIDGLLKVEFPRQKVEKAAFINNAALIKKQLPDFKKALQNGGVKIKLDTANKRTNILPEISTRIPVKAFLQEENTYLIENNGGQTVMVFGYRPKGTKDTVLIPNPLEIGVTHWLRDQELLKLPEKASAIYYTMDGSDFIGKATIIRWPMPKNVSPRQAFIKSVGNYKNGPVTREGDVLYIKGTYVLNELLYIPKGVKLIIEAGTKLVLKNTGGILSESPIMIKGTEQLPVQILSESAENQGLTVLQANTLSVFDHVQFSSMSNFSEGGWKLSGGINFYESDVVLNNCSIKNGKSEDALNIIRSTFELNSCAIENSNSDGFDSDFSKGLVSNCQFKNIGNDGLDFSGSSVKIVDCNLLNLGDKAISAGEQSTLTIERLTIDNAEIGVAAKDLSYVSVSNTSISNCSYGYVAYTKKAEYGGATIDVREVSLSDVEKRVDIELNSKLIEDGVVIPGKKYSSVAKY